MLATLDQKTQLCIDTCLMCYKACSQALAYCLDKGGKYADPKHIGLLMDCASICLACADVCLRGGNYKQLKIACDEVCQLCAASCSQFDDEILRKCAEMNRACVGTCSD